MKLAYFICVSVLIVGVVSSADTSSTKHEIHEAHQQCKSKQYIHVDDEILEKLRKAEQIDDPSIGVYLFCMYKKLNVQNENGDINEEIFKNMLRGVLGDDKDIDVIVGKCAVRKPYYSARKTAAQLYNCVSKNLRDDIRRRTRPFRESIREAHQECQENSKTDVDQGVFEDLIKGKSVDDDNLKKHVLCIHVKLNIQKENGDILISTIKKNLEENPEDEAKTNETLHECGNRAEGDSAEVTALKLFKCLHRNEHGGRHGGSNPGPLDGRRHESRKVQERVEQLKKFREECMADPATRIEKEVIPKMGKGEDADDPNLGAHLLCINIKANIQDSTGQINKDTIREDLESRTDDEELINKILKKCGERDSEDSATATAIKLFKCLHQRGTLRNREHEGQRRHGGRGDDGPRRDDESEPRKHDDGPDNRNGTRRHRVHHASRSREESEESAREPGRDNESEDRRGPRRHHRPEERDGPRRSRNDESDNEDEPRRQGASERRGGERRRDRTGTKNTEEKPEEE